jgi:hypothetical protein
MASNLRELISNITDIRPDEELQFLSETLFNVVNISGDKRKQNF